MKAIIRRRRTSERGAALVEAAVMVPLFLTITFSAMYAYNYGRAGIDAKIASRQEAWTLAMANCGSAGTNDSETLPIFTDPDEDTSGGIATNTPITHDPGGASLSTQLHGTLSGHGGGSFIVTLINGFFNVISPLFPNPTGSTNTQSETVNYRIPFPGHTGHAYAQRSASGGGPAGASSETWKATVMLSCNQSPSMGDHPLGILNAIAAAADAIVIATAPSPNL